MSELDQPRWSLALLQTKFTPPRPPRFAVDRPQLLARLSAALDMTLTVVIAPAGFGKTTLLAQWCDAEIKADRHVVGWLGLDDEDDDPRQLAAYVLASLCRAPGGVGRLAEQLMCHDPLSSDKVVISMLLNEIANCGKQVFLVIDDFDRPSSDPCRALLARLLHSAPDNFHVLLGLRSDPHVGLARFDTQRRLLRLVADDLRFSREDSRAFFASTSRLALDDPDIELLHEATEGWVTGLQLASLSLSTPDDAARVAGNLAARGFGVDAYFDDVVLPRLSPTMNDFLLRTSILGRLSPGICDALLGPDARSWEKLEWLERNNVFVTALDEDRQWLRYHALMSDLLRRRAERQIGSALPALHSRASAWFAAENLWLEAASHALLAGDVERASLWVESGASSLVSVGDVRTLLAWVGKLPTEVLNRRPRLRLAKAWALTLSFRTGEAAAEVGGLADDLRSSPPAIDDAGEADDATLRTGIAAVEAFIAVIADDTAGALRLGRSVVTAPETPPLWVRRFAEAALVYGLAHEGRFEEIRAMWDRAGERPDEHESLLFADVYWIGVYGMSLAMEGRLPEATERLQRVYALAERKAGRKSVIAALPAGYLASLYYERNDLVQARQIVRDSTMVAMEGCASGSLMRFCRTVARLHARQGDIASALDVLDRTRDVAGTRHWLRLRAGCDAETVRLHLAVGRSADAGRTADALRALMPQQLPAPLGSFLETWCHMTTIEARLAMANGRTGAAVTLLDALASQLAAAGMRAMEAEASLLLALALHQHGSRDEALDTLGRLMGHASRVRMIGSFLDEGERSLTLLQLWRARSAADTPDRFIDELLAAFPTDVVRSDEPRAHRSTLLSAREIEILNHIAEGLSNKEIARALHVAPETIKWHMKKIFGKLHVDSRIKAVRAGLGMPAEPLHDRRAASQHAL